MLSVFIEFAKTLSIYSTFIALLSICYWACIVLALMKTLEFALGTLNKCVFHKDALFSEVGLFILLPCYIVVIAIVVLVKMPGATDAFATLGCMACTWSAITDALHAYNQQKYWQAACYLFITTCIALLVVFLLAVAFIQ